MPVGLTDAMARPWMPRLLLFLLVELACTAAYLRETTLGYALAPALGPPGETGWYARIAIGAVLGVVAVLNVIAIGLLPRVGQILVTWLELLILILAFFSSFDLSVPFSLSRLPFLVYQGAFTTVYISMVSILIASGIALAAALARLSTSGPATSSSPCSRTRPWFRSWACGS